MFKYLPRELNFVKKVVVLKFKTGNTNTAKNIGTVLYKSQIGPKLSYDFSKLIE